jgi:uncharacterized protein
MNPAAMDAAVEASWTERFEDFLDEQMDGCDAAHDRAHIRRVVRTARQLAEEEGADLEIVLPAAWLHDCVALAKDDPARGRASRQAADAAIRFLDDAGYPAAHHDTIRHAIEAHSYSAGIEPRTIEAAVVQDADRLDALGAVGLARCFMVGGSLGNLLYHPEDPFCETRPPDDSAYIVDHFYEKLLRLPAMMNTAAGQQEGERRAEFLQTYLDRLRREIGE